jgi:hypothetical protein
MTPVSGTAAVDDRFTPSGGADKSAGKGTGAFPERLFRPEKRSYKDHKTREQRSSLLEPCGKTHYHIVYKGVIF